MKNALLLILLIPFLAMGQKQNDLNNFFNTNKGDDTPSKSLGTVSDGELRNAKLIPFSGDNFQYFDTSSYLNGRAYLNDKVKKTVLEAYQELNNSYPGRIFYIMECSNKNGGKIFPHRTHQNGLSVDFMMPKTKNDEIYTALDTLGTSHYFLDFDNSGKYLKDTTVKIDFEAVARHILLLHQKAESNGLMISKVIIKTELKDELFSSNYGQKLKDAGIYFVKSLTPLINSLHDDHYHIDYAILK